MGGLKVSIIGSGNWGSTMAKIVGNNILKLDNFNKEVKMFVLEEMINGKKLSEIINETHVNIKYLPKYTLPSNVVAVPDLVETAKDADFLIFVTPNQYIKSVCKGLVGKVKPNAIGLSLIKGFESQEGGGIQLISEMIHKTLRLETSVLMGANVANVVADGEFCETTIGCKNPIIGYLLKKLVHTNYFRVTVVEDVSTVELCGALKNIVACAAGFVDGLNYSTNTKAAIIRLGLLEMIRFIDTFYAGAKVTTFLESCGVADLITTCYGGRNRLVSEAFVRTGRPLKELEDEILQGQKLQGPNTAEEVNFMLKSTGKEKDFPLFTAVHMICIGEKKGHFLIDSLKAHLVNK